MLQVENVNSEESAWIAAEKWGLLRDFENHRSIASLLIKHNRRKKVNGEDLRKEDSLKLHDLNAIQFLIRRSASRPKCPCNKKQNRPATEAFAARMGRWSANSWGRSWYAADTLLSCFAAGRTKPQGRGDQPHCNFHGPPSSHKS